jgi:septum formation protein
VLALGGKIFGKAESIAEAREILTMLRGRTHELISAVALARGGRVHWQTSDFAEMTVRNFSDEFLGCYLEKIGNRALQSVGCYELEGPGVQLFEHIDGDYFTILGIPLIELLARLRHEGMVTA